MVPPLLLTPACVDRTAKMVWTCVGEKIIITVGVLSGCGGTRIGKYMQLFLLTTVPRFITVENTSFQANFS